MKLKRAETANYGAVRAITAAATRINLRDRSEVEAIRQRSSVSEWQADAWDYYDAVGEIKFGFGLVASVLSRLRLYAAAVVDPDSPPVRVADAATIKRPEKTENDITDDGTDSVRANGIDARLALAAATVLHDSFARTSVPDMLRTFGLNACVPGECYLLLHKGEWTIRSTLELTVDGTGRATLRPSELESRAPEILPAGTTIGRIWRRHPKRSMDADSSMKAVRSDCEELLLLGRMIRSTIRARMNAGILFIPDDVVVASRDADTAEQKDELTEEDQLERELIQALTEPIGLESSANAVVPLVMRGPAENADKIKHILLSRDGDEHLMARAQALLERILQSIDVPKDVVTGLANVKYSNAIQIDESLYKAHVEPLALMLCDAVTEIVLRPTLRAKGFTEEEVARVVVWYDPSEVVTRPDRAEDADIGYEKFLLNGSAWRQAHGFGDSDAPNEQELARRIALEKIQVPEEAATALLSMLLPTLLGAARAANVAPGTPGDLPDDLEALLQGGTPAAEPPPVEPVEVAESSVPSGGPA